MCEEESVLRRGAGAEVRTCAKLVHAEAITGFRNTQFWASRSEEAKGIKPREGVGSLRARVLQERGVIAVVSLAMMGSRIEEVSSGRHKLRTELINLDFVVI